MINNPSVNARDMCSITGSGRSLEKEMTTHSSILAWEIPWIEEPGELQSIKGQDKTDHADTPLIYLNLSSFFRNIG